MKIFSMNAYAIHTVLAVEAVDEVLDVALVVVVQLFYLFPKWFI